MPPEPYPPAQLPGIVCPYCGARNRTGSAACAFCGLPLPALAPTGPASPEQRPSPSAAAAPEPEAASAPSHCAWCGAANQEDAAWCATCGAAFPTAQSEARFRHELDMDLAVYRSRVHMEDFEREERLHRWTRRLAAGRALLRLLGPLG